MTMIDTCKEYQAGLEVRWLREHARFWQEPWSRSGARDADEQCCNIWEFEQR